jgi:hypothetical protein
MNWMNFARAGKAVALVAFLLPWLVVSCNATPIVSATGVDLVMGSVKTLSEQAPEQDSSPHLWAIATMVFILVGLAASFVLKPVRNAAAAIGAAAAAAFAIAAVGMLLTVSGIKSKMAEETPASSASAASEADNPFGPQFGEDMKKAMLEAIRIEPKYGYWLTLLGLAGAAGAAAMAFSGRVLPVMAGANAARAPADPDTAFWDNLDKSDRASLEEYILRFPEGRFVGLARMRLNDMKA